MPSIEKDFRKSSMITEPNILFKVAASIEPVLKAKHFEELVLASQDARNRLQDLGCFKDVEIHIDTSEDGGKSDYEVIFYCSSISRCLIG